MKETTGKERRTEEIKERPDVLKEQMETAAELYGQGLSLRKIADQMGINHVKVKKLLVSAGVYRSEAGERVMALYREGKNTEEIMKATGLSQASVNAYLPFTRMATQAEKRRNKADIMARLRKRNAAVEVLHEEPTADHLWETVLLFQGYPFHTAKGLRFTYTVKGGEMFISRKEKSITRSSVEIAFQKALEGGITGPKKLGVFGASYLYPLFVRLGLVDLEDGQDKAE